MQIIITGSRDWPVEDKGQVFDTVLALVRNKAKQNETVTLKVGDCPTGVDSFIDELSTMLPVSNPVSIQRFAANWRTYGLAAGPIRNKLMARTGADYCLAFIWGGRKDSRGTRDCARKAAAAGISVRLIRHRKGGANGTQD